MSVLFKRTLSSIFLFIIFVFCYYNQNHLFFLSLASIFIFLALFELCNLANIIKFEKLIYWTLSLSLFIFFILKSIHSYYIVYMCFFFWAFIAPITIYKKQIFFNSFKFLIYPILILGVFFSVFHLYFYDKSLLLLVFFLVWISDISAYFFGKKFGKNKLAPFISPGKTIEGVLGAFLMNTIFIIIYSLLFSINFFNLLILVIILVPASILGDLFESLIKRESNKKDSSNIIPGHGGILDRIDSLISVLPLMTFFSLQGFHLWRLFQLLDQQVVLEKVHLM